MNLEYLQNGDYLIPNLTLSEQPPMPLGKYGRMRKIYLQEHRPALYSHLLLSEKLYPHLLEIDQAANKRLELLMPPMARAAGITEHLKATDQMKWVGLMNTVKAQVEGIIFVELIYKYERPQKSEDLQAAKTTLDKTTTMSHNKKDKVVVFVKGVEIVPKKGERTKSEIISIAKNEFCKKGFSAVTMSDLCEATGLSRGGLYRHFSSTDEVFIALLEADKDDWQTEMDKAMEKGVPAIHMMGYYLEQMRMGIAEGAGGLSLAIYEFMRNKQVESVFLDARYDFAVNMMKALLQYGQQRGEFKPCNLQTEAEHIVIFLDGLQTASAVIPFSDEVISRQLSNVLEKIKMEER